MKRATTGDRKPAGNTASTQRTGTIIAAHGRNYVVDVGDDEPVHAVIRGKRGEVCVGDRVRIALLGGGQGVIEAVEDRRFILMRSDRFRRKLLAANVDQAAIVVAPEPRFDESLLLRVLIACVAAGIEPVVIATKADLVDPSGYFDNRMEALAHVGHGVVRISVQTAPVAAIEALRPTLEQRCTVLLGESGMGKSSLVNLLVPGADQQTRAISSALAAGRHTTTFARLFRVPEEIAPGTSLIDTPGFQSFGLAHLSASERVHAMPDFRPHIGRCRFHNCTHRNEPGCAIRRAAESNDIDPIRYRLFNGVGED